MPKLKTHKGAASRIRVTGTGKLMHHRAGRRHLLANRPAKRMRQLRHATEASPTQDTMVRRLLPYSGRS